MSRIAYIVSLRSGVQASNYREIREMINLGEAVYVYPTIYNQGPYMPTPDMHCYRYNPLLVVLRQALIFLRRPKKYLACLFDAVRYRAPVDFLIGMDFARHMTSEGIERIHAHFGGHQFFIGHFCRKLTGLPLSVTIHASSLYTNTNIPLYVKALRECDKVVAISKWNAKRLQEKFGVDPKKIATIHVFVDMDDFRKDDTKKILIVGYFSPKKGHEMLFRAVKKSGRKDVRVWVVGSSGQLRFGSSKGDFTYDAVGAVKRLGIEDQVVFFENVSHETLKLLYQNCDLYCQPSVTVEGYSLEGIPSTIMEAMAFGKPVVCTRHSGIPELVEEVLVDEYDDEGLAEALIRLVDNEELRRRLGEKNRKIVSERFSKKNVESFRDFICGRTHSEG